MAKQKWGAGHASGMIRKGFKEIGPVFQAFPDSIRSPEEPGVFGNITAQEVQETKGKPSAYNEWLDARAKESAKDHEPPEQGMER
jgi:hypothetical protein